MSFLLFLFIVCVKCNLLVIDGGWVDRVKISLLREVPSSAASNGREDKGQAQARTEENILAQELKGLVWC